MKGTEVAMIRVILAIGFVVASAQAFAQLTVPKGYSVVKAKFCYAKILLGGALYRRILSLEHRQRYAGLSATAIYGGFYEEYLRCNHSLFFGVGLMALLRIGSRNDQR